MSKYILIISLIICLMLTGCKTPEEEKNVIEITVHANSDYCDMDDEVCPPPEEYREGHNNGTSNK